MVNNGWNKTENKTVIWNHVRDGISTGHKIVLKPLNNSRMFKWRIEIYSYNSIIPLEKSFKTKLQAVNFVIKYKKYNPV